MIRHKALHLLPEFRHAVVTIGSFDGVHQGHRKMIERLIEEARRRNGESIVITFEPHPRVALGRAEGMIQLTSAEEKTGLVSRLGVDHMIFMHFDREFAAMTGEEFVRKILIDTLHAEMLVVGYNHRFGHDRADKSVAERAGLEVVEVGECTVDGEKVSSTVIRRLIAEGNKAKAELLAGHPLNVFI